MSTAAKPITDLTTGKPPRRRFRLPVSLRMFVALLAILCVVGVLPVGWKTYRQWAAIREIEKAKGTATFERGSLSWLNGWVPESWLQPFKKLERVDLPFSETLDADTTHLLAIRPLPRLYIEGAPSVPGFDGVGQLDELRSFLARYHVLLFSRQSYSGGTLLHNAVDRSHSDFRIDHRLAIFRLLLEQGAEVDAIGEHGDTSLRMAEHPEIVKLLLEHGANLAAGGPNEGILEITAHEFVLNGPEGREYRLAKARLLREAGAEYNIVSACCLDDLARVRELVKRGRPPREHDALYIAAAYGRAEIARVLLEQGADPNDRSKEFLEAPPFLLRALGLGAVLYDGGNGAPVAFHAIRHPDLLEVLFAGRGDPSSTVSRGGIDGWSLLHEAADADVLESVKLVLNRGVPIDKGDEAGETPLHVAARAGHVEVVRLLLARGADAKVRTKDGQTAIFYAASEIDLAGGSKTRTELQIADRREIVELLSDAGAPLDLFRAIALGRTTVCLSILADVPDSANNRNSYGTPVLDFSVALDRLEIAIALIDAGADVSAADGWGSTALHTAASLGRVEIAKILIAHQADVTAADSAGLTPLHVAARQLQPECVRLFLAAGAKRAALDHYDRTPLDLARGSGDSTGTEAQQQRLAETIELLREPLEPAQ